MKQLMVLLWLGVWLTPWAGVAVRADDYAHARERMIRSIEAMAQSTPVAGKPHPISPDVLAAMAQVERHKFVPWALRALAYENRPLPIGHGQTISQPYIVALMTDLLELRQGDVVLEVGTGSGYQAAVLAALGVRVRTVEIIKGLADEAKARLKELNYARATASWADGYHGDAPNAPFDGIIVTSAASHIPPPLIAQLKAGGRMIVPVGPKFMAQQLVLVAKSADGKVTTRRLLPVVFVPFTRTRKP